MVFTQPESQHNQFILLPPNSFPAFILGQTLRPKSVTLKPPLSYSVANYKEDSEDNFSQASKSMALLSGCPNPKSEPTYPDPVTIPKRPLEVEVEEDTDGKRCRKKQGVRILDGVSTSHGSERAPFRRLWSEADVIVILKGLFDFRAMKKLSPKKSIGTFYDFMKQSLPVSASRESLSSKIGKLKKRYMANINNRWAFPDEAFELSDKLWRSEVTMKKPSTVEVSVDRNKNSEYVGNVDGALDVTTVRKKGSSHGDCAEKKVVMIGAEFFEVKNGVEGSKKKDELHFQDSQAASHGFQGVRSILRVWSEADDIAILKRMIYYSAAMKKSSTSNCTSAFHDFSMEFLHVDASRQHFLTNKIKELKDMYERNKVHNGTLSKEAFELCQMIWGRDTTKNCRNITANAIDNKNSEDMGNLDVADIAMEKNVSGCGINVAEKIDRVFEGGNIVEGAKEWKKNQILLAESTDEEKFHYSQSPFNSFQDHMIVNQEDNLFAENVDLTSVLLYKENLLKLPFSDDSLNFSSLFDYENNEFYYELEELPTSSFCTPSKM